MKLVQVGLCYDHRLLTSPRQLRRIASQDVLLFPELFDGGYAALLKGKRPHRSDDPFITDLVTASMTVPTCIVAGSTYLDNGRGSRTNSSLTFQSGHLLHRYDKIHLFGPTADKRYFTPGRSVRPFVLKAGDMRLRAGVIICYDLRFPELTRSLAQQGIRILFVPARWPKVRDDAWQSLLKARAIENQIFVIGCNAPGSEGGFSYAFDPLGRMVFSGRKVRRGSLQTFALDLNAIAEAHALHVNLEDALLLRERPPLRTLRIPAPRPARISSRKSAGRSRR
jgi:predicted amidohydrolase